MLFVSSLWKCVYNVNGLEFDWKWLWVAEGIELREHRYFHSTQKFVAPAHVWAHMLLRQVKYIILGRISAASDYGLATDNNDNNKTFESHSKWVSAQIVGVTIGSPAGEWAMHACVLKCMFMCVSARKNEAYCKRVTREETPQQSDIAISKKYPDSKRNLWRWRMTCH